MDTTTKDGPRNLAAVLHEIEQRAREEDGVHGLSVGEILRAVGRRSYGPLLLVVGIISISPITAIPGLTWASAALTLVICLHIAVGAQRLWLPANVLALRAPEGPLIGFLHAVRPAARAIDAVLKPRLEFLSRPYWVNVVGAAGVGAALVTFPLGFVPLLPLFPGVAIVLIGLGMTARDGVVMVLGALLVPFALISAAHLFL